MTNATNTADTALASLKYIPEIEWSELPTAAVSGAPNTMGVEVTLPEYEGEHRGMRELRFTSEDLGISRQTTVSDEIRADRQISDLIQTHVEAQGGVKGEMSYGTYDELLEGAMNSSWEDALVRDNDMRSEWPDASTPPGTADRLQRNDVRVGPSDESTPELAAVYDKITFHNDSSMEQFSVGMGLKISGFSASGNNRIVVIRSIGEHHIIVAPPLAEAADGTPPENDVFFEGQVISNGVEDKSYTIEKSFTDVGKAVAYTGMVVKGMSLEVESESKITVGFDFMGRNGESFDTSDENAPPTPTLRMNTADPVPELMVNQTTAGVGEKELITDSIDPSGSLDPQRGDRFTVSGAPTEYTVTNYVSNVLHFEPGLAAVAADNDTIAFTYKNRTIPPTVSEIMSAGIQDGTIIEGTTVIGLVKGITLQIENNVRGKQVVGLVGNADIGKGRFNVTGTLSTYFEDFRLYDKYLKNEGTSLVFTLTSPDGGTYIFNMPNIKFTESSVMAGGPDQDVMVDGSFQALMDPASEKTLIITRVNP